MTHEFYKNSFLFKIIITNKLLLERLCKLHDVDCEVERETTKCCFSTNGNANNVHSLSISVGYLAKVYLAINSRLADRILLLYHNGKEVSY